MVDKYSEIDISKFVAAVLRPLTSHPLQIELDIKQRSVERVRRVEGYESERGERGEEHTALWDRE